MTTSVQSIIEQFYSDYPTVVAWGHTERLISVIRTGRYNLYNDPKYVTTLRSRYHLLQVLLMGWEALQADTEKGAAEDKLVSQTCKDIINSVWRCIPCFLDEQAQHVLQSSIRNCNTTQQYDYFVQNSHNFWTMPAKNATDTSIGVEQIWTPIFETISIDGIGEVLRSTEKYLKILIERLGAHVQSSIELNTQMLVDMVSEDKQHPLCGAALEWLLSVARGLLDTKGEFHPPLSALPSDPIPFTEMAEQWVGLPANTLSQSFVYSWEISWDIIIGIPGKTSELLTTPSSTFNEYILNNLSDIHAHKEILYEKMGFEGSRRWLKITPLNEADFKFLGHDWNNLKALVCAKEPLRALIVGSNGSGKTALVRTLADISDKNIAEPVIHDLFWGHHGIESAHRKGLRKKTLVVLDNAHRYLLQSDSAKNSIADQLLNGELRQKMEGPEVWTVPSTEGIAATVLAHFDLVVNLANMPLPQRIDLARTHFDDSELANRVAQSCATPGQILDLVRWKQVTGQNDWMSLSSRLAGVQRAIVESKENDGALPLSIHHPTPTSIGFAAVVGQDNIVLQAKRAIAGLKDPLRFQKLGGKVPKGILLKGGPGMGKTHLARAMAQEAGVPLLLADSAAMAQTPELISKVFAEARRQSPCLLFLDELDAIGSKAQGAFGASPDPKRQAILNRVLMELDGFNQLDGVLVIGATHRSELLDSALVRSGRLGLHMELEDPTTQAREDLWHFYMKNITVGDINWKRLSKISSGMSPADIAQSANQAVMLAFSDDADSVDTKHVVEAIDATLWGGSPSDVPIVADELHRVAVHEAGHALIAWRNGEDIERISVRPRSNALGFVRTLPEEGRYGLTSSTVANRLAMCFGGLAAETVTFGGHASGVSSDLEQCRRIARFAIRVEGMDKELPAGIPVPMEAALSSDLIQKSEVIENALLAKMREETIKWMEAHKPILEKFAEYILQEREIDGDEARSWLLQHSTIKQTTIQSSVELMAAAIGWSKTAV